MSWTAPRTWVAGETVTAALMNAHVRDNLLAIGGAWTGYTPTLAQGASTDIAKTVTYAKYVAAGKLILGQVSVAATAAGSAGSAITLTIPVTAAIGGIYVGTGQYNDNGTFYQGNVLLVSTTAVQLSRLDSIPTGGIGADPNIAVASGDSMSVSFWYEAA